MIAERKNDGKPDGGTAGSNRDEEDESSYDEPVWSSVLRKKTAAVPEKAENESTVDRVLRMIPGTIVN